MTSILGSSLILIAGGISRLGPINPKGDALSEKIGSVRIVSPSFLIKKVANTVQKKAEQQFVGNQQNTSNIKEGETIIDKAPRKPNQSNNSVGEYVDYEEID